MKPMNRSSSLTGWLFVSPFVLNAVILFLIPLAWAFWLAGTDWNLMSLTWNWVGFSNLSEALGDEKVWAAFFNGLKFLAVVVPLIVLLSLGIGAVLHNVPPAMKGFFSVAFFVPYLTSGVATSVFVRYFFSYSSPLNLWLRDNGVEVAWFTDPEPAYWIIVGVIVWKVVGYFSLFIFAAWESIPTEIGEAAELDGATGLTRFVAITFPMIFPSIQSVLLLAAGLVYGIFSEPYLLTGGGPENATLTWQLLLFNTSFVSFRSGYGAVVAILMALCIFLTLRLVVSLTKKFVDNAGRD